MKKNWTSSAKNFMKSCLQNMTAADVGTVVRCTAEVFQMCIRDRLDILQEERKADYSGGIYHKTQIELTYHSNRMEGSRLTHDPVSYTHLDVYKRQVFLPCRNW